MRKYTTSRAVTTVAYAVNAGAERATRSRHRARDGSTAGMPRERNHRSATSVVSTVAVSEGTWLTGFGLQHVAVEHHHLREVEKTGQDQAEDDQVRHERCGR